jgi:hypothetical protein
MRTAAAVALGIVVFIVATLGLMLFGAFCLRGVFGVERYRDLGLPALAIGGGIAGGIGSGFLAFRRLRAST